MRRSLLLVRASFISQMILSPETSTAIRVTIFVVALLCANRESSGFDIFAVSAQNRAAAWSAHNSTWVPAVANASFNRLELYPGNVLATAGATGFVWNQNTGNWTEFDFGAPVAPTVGKQGFVAARGGNRAAVWTAVNSTWHGLAARNHGRPTSAKTTNRIRAKTASMNPATINIGAGMFTI